MPSLTNKKKEEVIKLLDEMGLKYELKGNGKAISQKPQPGEKLKLDTTVIVEFK